MWHHNCPHFAHFESMNYCLFQITRKKKKNLRVIHTNYIEISSAWGNIPELTYFLQIADFYFPLQS